MATKKDLWISGREAADLLTEQSGHKVDPSYVRMMAREGKIRTRPIDGRTNEYLKEDVVGRQVKAKRKSATSVEFKVESPEENKTVGDAA